MENISGTETVYIFIKVGVENIVNICIINEGLEFVCAVK